MSPYHHLNINNDIVVDVAAPRYNDNDDNYLSTEHQTTSDNTINDVVRLKTLESDIRVQIWKGVSLLPLKPVKNHKRCSTIMLAGVLLVADLFTMAHKMFNVNEKLMCLWQFSGGGKVNVGSRSGKMGGVKPN